MVLDYKDVKISWLSHSSFRINDRKTLYIDPYQIGHGPKADIILITHEHFDHCKLEDIKKVTTDHTLIIAPSSCLTQLKSHTFTVKEVKPGDEFDIDGIKVTAIHAYNVDKYRAPDRLFHPKEEMKVGYIIRIEGVSIYHAGDTDHIPEMDDLDVDVAFLPVSGVYVMTAEEAAQATQNLKVKVAIPMHYGSIVGDEGDAKKFKECAACTVKILKREE